MAGDFKRQPIAKCVICIARTPPRATHFVCPQAHPNAPTRHSPRLSLLAPRLPRTDFRISRAAKCSGCRDRAMAAASGIPCVPAWSPPLSSGVGRVCVASPAAPIAVPPSRSNPARSGLADLRQSASCGRIGRATPLCRTWHTIWRRTLHKGNGGTTRLGIHPTAAGPAATTAAI